MKYSIESAHEYANKNELDKWCQLFLRDGGYEHANPNIPLADGLLLEERFYAGPFLIDFSKITPMRIDEHLGGNELDFYLEKESGIVENYNNLNMPPLILEYKDDKLYLVDGSHRFSALRKMGINEYYAIVWGNKDKEKEFYEGLNSKEESKKI